MDASQFKVNLKVWHVKYCSCILLGVKHLDRPEKPLNIQVCPCSCPLRMVSPAVSRLAGLVWFGLFVHPFMRMWNTAAQSKLPLHVEEACLGSHQTCLQSLATPCKLSVHCKRCGIAKRLLMVWPLVQVVCYRGSTFWCKSHSGTSLGTCQ
jgi:hypothetical protein